MILILGGTTEGREIATELALRGYPVLVTVASSYGMEMFPEKIPVEILVGRQDTDQFKKLMEQRGINLVIDATHPHATLVTERAWQASGEKGIPFIRFERSAGDSLTDGEAAQGPLIKVKDYQAAAQAAVEIAAEQGGSVFLTTGSKNLQPFVDAVQGTNVRLVARVLPDPEGIRQCLALGIKPANIVAVQGPFSLEMNAAMLKEYGASVLVTKDSGEAGGVSEKTGAAKLLGIPVVMVERPRYAYVPVVYSMEAVFLKVEEHQNKN